MLSNYTKAFAYYIGLGPLFLTLIGLFLPSYQVVFLAECTVALIAALLFININLLTQLNQWFIEKVISISTISCFLTLLLFGMPFASRIVLFSFINLFFNLFFTIIRPNTKNIILLLINFFIGYVNLQPFSSSIFLGITLLILISYLFESLVTHNISFYQDRFVILICSLLISIVIYISQLNTDHYFIVPTALFLTALPILGVLVLSYGLVRSELKVKLTPVLIYLLLFTCIFGQAGLIIAQEVINPWFIIELFILLTAILISFSSNISKNSKISIIIPSYNGADTIVQTLDSVISQTYKNWEIILVDDGSNDNTKEVVGKYLKENPNIPVKYLKEENKDQLNAIKYALPHINGEVVHILHSDDLLASKYVLKQGLFSLLNQRVVGTFINLEEVNEQGKHIRLVKTASFYPTKQTLAKAAVTFGRNPYVDVVFWTKDIFENSVYKNYLTNNMPAWFDNENKEILSISNGIFTSLKYRIFEGNYLNSQDGAVNVLSGELRFFHHLVHEMRIPQFKWQSFVYRVLRKLNCDSLYSVIYIKKKSSLSDLTPKIISLRLDSLENRYIHAIYDFSQNYAPNDNVVVDLEIANIYHGADIRIFNRKLSNGTLEKGYYQIMKIISSGKGIWQVPKQDIRKYEEILEFFTIKDYVEIEEINK
ncbi:glycosyltransferase family 2 protein [Lactobacillus jensenii]|uniref:glycosyltransferase family 2 protein n=1 Tax=Lactobacillus jensenii TaxID=109790 RepID=UPI001F091DD5|nr:glycosyltransferase family 2 protein [Lactobacillus jensenii]